VTFKGAPLPPTWQQVGSVILVTIPKGFPTNPTNPPPFTVTLYDGSPCGPGYNCNSTATVNFSLG
jgi:hypothetical protein